ncbi:transcription factor bHLH36-like [Capsicum chacoense]
MDNNYLWEIFTNKKQNISEDHDNHHHQLLQIPNFQQNGFSQQDNQDLIEDPFGSSVITSQLQTSCDQLYKPSTINTSTSIVTPRFQTKCDQLYKSSAASTRSTSINMPGQFQTSCDRPYKSPVGTKITNLDRNNKEGLTRNESNKLKKVVHRNVERHRRKEMANLVNSLRSLIPIEFIKGKRSASDHMQVAVNYIKHLQKNIQELDNTRKNIKNIISLDDQNKSSTNITFQKNNICVTVNKCEDGMEILINVNNSHKEEIFSLSKVLRWLLEEGLNVVSCVNSKQDEWSLIMIQCQVNNISSGLTLVGLQKKLIDLIN